MKRRKAQPCIGRGVSLPKDVLDRVDERLAQLHPKVKGFSHYIQLLVDWDLNGDGVEKRPFKAPEPQLAGFAE